MEWTLTLKGTRKAPVLLILDVSLVATQHTTQVHLCMDDNV